MGAAGIRKVGARHASSLYPHWHDIRLEEHHAASDLGSCCLVDVVNLTLGCNCSKEEKYTASKPVLILSQALRASGISQHSWCGCQGPIGAPPSPVCNLLSFLQSAKAVCPGHSPAMQQVEQEPEPSAPEPGCPFPASSHTHASGGPWVPLGLTRQFFSFFICYIL